MKTILTRKSFWVIAFIYSVIVLILIYTFHSPAGEFLIQIGYFALLVGLILFIGANIKLIISSIRNKKKETSGK